MRGNTAPVGKGRAKESCLGKTGARAGHWFTREAQGEVTSYTGSWVFVIVEMKTKAPIHRKSFNYRVRGQGDRAAGGWFALRKQSKENREGLGLGQPRGSLEHRNLPALSQADQVAWVWPVVILAGLQGSGTLLAERRIHL